MVKYWVLSYYNPTEAISTYGKHLKYDDINNIIKNIGYSVGTAYGSVNIDFDRDDYMLYIWTLKIKFEIGRIYIGIDSSNKLYINDDFSSPNNDKYDYYSIASQYIFAQNVHCEQEYLDRFKWINGDIIKIAVNTKTKTIRLKQNLFPYINVFKNIEFKNKIFNLAITLSIHESVQIIDFMQIKIT